MNHFIVDDQWQKEIRERLLKPFYENCSFDGRYVFADKGKLATTLQREMEVDTVMQLKENGILAIEEKIVRWPGYEYWNFTLETMSCTVPGRERQGWMFTGQSDYLMYCFVQDGDQSVVMYAIPFQELKTWFLEEERYKSYKSTFTDQINKTECKLVPIYDVLKAIPKTKKIILPKA